MSAPVPDFKRSALAATVERVVNSTPVVDIHTHLYDPSLGGLLLWGIDELLTYHYLVSESYRHSGNEFNGFWALRKPQQAEFIWQSLFVDHSPLSEARRGVLTTLHRLGIEPKQGDLAGLREWFAGWPVDEYVSRCFELANIKAVVMSNSPFDEVERPIWQRGFPRDERFVGAFRIDPLLTAWPDAAQTMGKWGYGVGEGFSPHTISEVRRFLADWTRRLDARYLMASLPPEFAFPGQSDCAQMLEQAVMPHCRESGVPLALMLGVRRSVNPELRLAGDGVGRSDLSALSNLCAGFPDVRFLVTVLARENQHELCVLARKFRNLHIFGCWWFCNIPSLIEETTRMRLELLGTSFTAQHSDARVLDQVIYKWDHSRKVLARVMVDKYVELARAGWEPAAEEVERDVGELLGGAFELFCQR